MSTLQRLPYGFAGRSCACVLTEHAPVGVWSVVTKHAPVGACSSSMHPLECTEHAFEFAEH